MKKALLILFIFSFCPVTVQTQPNNILGDLHILGNSCIGDDCPVGPLSFGFSNLILKEYDLRILFDDASITPGFPSNDWMLLANDSNNGGENLFSIVDVTAGDKRIFTLEAGTQSFFHMNPLGHVGIGTTNPVKDFHILGGNSPGILLEQEAGVWPGHKWLMQGNETFFSIGGIIPGIFAFLIRKESPENSIYINSNGNVNLGANNLNPQKLYVNGTMAVTGDLYAISDFRVKKEIKILQYGIKEIMQLTPKQYAYQTERYPELHLPSEPQIGLIAQEVEAVIPEVITTEHSIVSENGEHLELKGINYNKLIPVMITAIQEQQIKIKLEDDTLNQIVLEVEELKKQVSLIRDVLNLSE